MRHSPVDTSGTEVSGLGIFGSGVSGTGPGFLVSGNFGNGIFGPGLGFPEHLFFDDVLNHVYGDLVSLASYRQNRLKIN